jgi:hypothetical protein
LQCSILHHSDPRHRHWPATFGNQHQRLRCGPPFGIVFCLEQFGDVEGGVAKLVSLRSAKSVRKP